MHHKFESTSVLHASCWSTATCPFLSELSREDRRRARGNVDWTSLPLKEDCACSFSLLPDNLPVFPHVIVSQNAYGSVGAIVSACFALISIQTAALFYLSLYCPVLLSNSAAQCLKVGGAKGCAGVSEQPPNLPSQSINVIRFYIAKMDI